MDCRNEHLCPKQYERQLFPSSRCFFPQAQIFFLCACSDTQSVCLLQCWQGNYLISKPVIFCTWLLSTPFCSSDKSKLVSTQTVGLNRPLSKETQMTNNHFWNCSTFVVTWDRDMQIKTYFEAHFIPIRPAFFIREEREQMQRSLWGEGEALLVSGGALNWCSRYGHPRS